VDGCGESRAGFARGTLSRIGTGEDLACPQCGVHVLDGSKYIVGRPHRAMCLQCHEELVCHADAEDNPWKVGQSAPLLGEVPGGRD
jgi:hypothetical protein